MKPVKSATPAQKGNTDVKASKSTSAKKAKDKVIKKNLEAAANEAEDQEEDSGRKSKYNYPDNCSADEKKKFRRLARAENSRFEREIKKLKKKTDPESQKELKSLQKKYEAFKSETYSEQ